MTEKEDKTVKSQDMLFAEDIYEPFIDQFKITVTGKVGFDTAHLGTNPEKMGKMLFKTTFYPLLQFI